MSEINLLPKGRLSTSRFGILAGKLKLANLAITGVLLVSLLVMGGLVVVNSRTLASLNARLEQLRSSIYSLRAVEGQYSLLKNRLAGISQVYTQIKSEPGIAPLSDLALSLPPGASITDIGLTKGVVVVSLDLVDARSLSEVISKVLATGVYRSVQLESLGYTKDKGYQLSVNFMSN